jgi:hypothetical protein
MLRVFGSSCSRASNNTLATDDPRILLIPRLAQHAFALVVGIDEGYYTRDVLLQQLATPSTDFDFSRRPVHGPDVRMISTDHSFEDACIVVIPPAIVQVTLSDWFSAIPNNLLTWIIVGNLQSIVEIGVFLGKH